MARILAIMLFLCKFFFQLLPAVYPILGAVFREVDGTEPE